MSDIVERLRAALENLVRWSEQQACHHDEVRRGGAIWTICCECGEKWADDQGGFKPYQEPDEIAAARAALSAFPHRRAKQPMTMPETIEIKATLEWRGTRLFLGGLSVGYVVERNHVWHGWLEGRYLGKICEGDEHPVKSAVVQALKNALGVKEP